MRCVHEPTPPTPNLRTHPKHPELDRHGLPAHSPLRASPPRVFRCLARELSIGRCDYTEPSHIRMSRLARPQGYSLPPSPQPARTCPPASPRPPHAQPPPPPCAQTPSLPSTSGARTSSRVQTREDVREDEAGLSWPQSRGRPQLASVASQLSRAGCTCLASTNYRWNAVRRGGCARGFRWRLLCGRIVELAGSAGGQSSFV